MNEAFPAGKGVFETIKTFHGAPWFVSQHLDRAICGVKVLGIVSPAVAKLEEELFEYLQQNPVATELGRLRLSIFEDGEIRFLHEEYEEWSNPSRLLMVDAPVDQSAAFAGIKTLPYVQNIALLDNAHSQGFDDVVRLNLRNELCESAVANILVRIGGDWITPNLASGCLPGITRGLLVEHLDIQERRVCGDEIAHVNAAFLLSSLKGAQPVEVIDERPLEIISDMTQKVRELLLELSVG